MKSSADAARIALGVLLAFAVLYSLYSGTKAQVDKDLRRSSIAACERSKVRDILFSEFAREAAAARRANAAADSESGKVTEAANELATAQKYESFAKRADNLSPKDCTEAFPRP
jgi:hypothetical protein